MSDLSSKDIVGESPVVPDGAARGVLATGMVPRVSATNGATGAGIARCTATRISVEHK
jgi:hypothetical protein